MSFHFTVLSRLSRRSATEASRFRVALSLGLSIALVGSVSVGLYSEGFAQDFLTNLFSGALFGVQQQAAQPQTTDGSVGYQSRTRHRHVAERSHKKVVHETDEHGVPASGHSVCVRLCDGFVFPVGNYHGLGDRASHEATCQSECPGAETALFVMPNGSDSIGSAVQADTGKNYSELPSAFHYSTLLSETCTCHPAAGNKIKSVLHDFTLRRGDVVATRTGFKVFHGSSQFPYKQKDFVALGSSKDIRKSERGKYKEIERASMIADANVAHPRKAEAAIKPEPAKRVDNTDTNPPADKRS